MSVQTYSPMTVSYSQPPVKTQKGLISANAPKAKLTTMPPTSAKIQMSVSIRPTCVIKTPPVPIRSAVTSASAKTSGSVTV